MAPLLAVLALALAFATRAAASPARRAPPTVRLDSATVTGVADGRVARFLGIPFAQPPTGDLRFRLPQPLPAYTGALAATAFGPACPQQAVDLPLLAGLAADAADFVVNTIYGAVFPDSEDCLTVNVVAPAGATPASKLPVAVWIFGGGFELGSPTIYDGGVIVERSLDLGEPVVYVSMNYRLSAFGFLASQEVKEAGVGNLGLQDQRAAFRWVQKYIAAFGGDPTKVTIWGESAGAISVALHLLTNNGNAEGLFRGAVMQSGSPIPVGDIAHGQPYYDALVAATGCAGAGDTLACLRTVDYGVLKAAMDQSPGIFAYQSLVLAWLPRVDGVFLEADPQTLVQQGSVARVPIISGDCDDEGTLFALSTLNITTESQLRTYLATTWLPRAAPADIAALLAAYPADPAQGSPFGTGALDAPSAQFKRIAAFMGDAVFQAPRRVFLRSVAGAQPVWAFLSKRLKALPVLGSAHGSDILNVYGGGELTDALVHFVATLDPNAAGGDAWPRYTAGAPAMLTFLDGLVPHTLTQDTYRAEAMEVLTNVTLANPI